MKEIPILFSTPMVQAILAGRKTQTRRKIPVQPDSFGETQWWMPEYCKQIRPPSEEVYKTEAIKRCKYGQPGYILWVRETYMKHPDVTIRMIRDGGDTWNEYEYIADLDKNEIDQFKEWGWKTKPSIFMPKAACRIKLLVKNIRVERLQDISAEDAKAEGIIELAQSKMQLVQNGSLFFDYSKKEELFNDGLPAIKSYKSLWQSINGPDSWDKNPWCWCIEFERVQV